MLLPKELKKYRERRERKRKTGRIENNSSARLRPFEGKRGRASTRQIVAHDVGHFLGPRTPILTHRSFIQQTMTITIAAATGANAAGEVGVETTGTGV